MKQYRLVVYIAATSRRDAERMRAEIVGIVEDNAESREVPVVVTVSALDYTSPGLEYPRPIFASTCSNDGRTK